MEAFLPKVFSELMWNVKILVKSLFSLPLTDFLHFICCCCRKTTIDEVSVIWYNSFSISVELLQKVSKNDCPFLRAADFIRSNLFLTTDTFAPFSLTHKIKRKHKTRSIPATQYMQWKHLLTGYKVSQGHFLCREACGLCFLWGMQKALCLSSKGVKPLMESNIPTC